MSIKKINFYVVSFAICAVITTGLFIYVSAQQPKETPTDNTNTSAQEHQQTEAGELEKPSPEDFFLAGQSVEVKSENAVGDVAVAGANITVSDKVQGYVMAAGANVNMNAPVGNDLWIAGANVFVNGSVADNAMLAGGSVVIGENTTIGNNARIAAGSVEVKGKIKRNLSLAASTAQISSEVGGDVYSVTENLKLNPGAVVRGSLVVYSPSEPIISPDAKVFGQVKYHKTDPEGNNKTYSSAIASWFTDWFLTFLWIAILGLVAVWFSPVWTNRVAEMLKTKTGKSALVGLVVMLAIPILFILLLITVVGLPVAFLLGALALVAFLLSGVFVSYFIGDWILNQLKRWENSNVLKILFGALVITFVMTLPWIGWLAKFAVMFFGVGAFLLERRDLLRTLREQGLA